MNRLIMCGLMGVVLLLGAACATTDVTPSASVTTLQPAWPHYFKLEWAANPSGSRSVTGYLSNVSGNSADNVQILAQALDASGSVVGQRIARIPGMLPGYDRVYIRVDDLPAANSYRLSVWNFEFRDADSR